MIKNVNTYIEKFAAWAEGKDDLVNPFLVRNLRQSVRSRAFLSIFGLLLLFTSMVAFFGYFGRDVSTYERQGSKYFGIFYVLLNIATQVAIPFFLANSLRQEKLLKQDEQILITTLTPNQIIRGFIYSGVVMILVVFSALSPFMMYTYLLRGIDQLTILFALVTSFLSSALLCCLAMAMVSLGEEEKNKLNAMGLFVFLALSFCWGFSALILSEGASVSRMVREPTFWLYAAFILSIYICQFLLLHKVAVAGIMEEHSPRSTGIRWAFLIQFGVLLFWAVISILKLLPARVAKDFPPEVIVFSSLMLWAVGAFIFCVEKEILSERQKQYFRDAPMIYKIFSPLVMPGSARGFMLVFCGLFATFALVPFCKSSRDISTPVLIAIGFILGYICIPAQLYRFVAGSKFSLKTCRNVVIWGNLFLIIFTSFMSPLVSHRNDNIFSVLNPFMAMAIQENHNTALVLAFGLIIVAILVYWASVMEVIRDHSSRE